jgi:hypothetical protein
VLPRLEVSEFHPLQAKILNAVAYLLGMRGGSVAYLSFTEDEEIEPSINDIAKNDAEDALNSVRNNN